MQDYAKLLHEDLAPGKDAQERGFGTRACAEIEIERAANKLKINIYTARPGIIIGRKGAEVDKLKQEIQKRHGQEVFINIQEIQQPELDAQLVAESVALQLERRIAFRRAMRKAVESALRFGAQGIKIRVLGPPERRRDRALRVVPARASCRCRPCARTSTTASPRPTRPTARSASRCGSTRARLHRSKAAPARAVRDEVLPC